MEKHKDLYLEIGKRIKIAREAANFTQDKLAEALGKSTQFISDMERGVSGPSLYTIICLCRQLHVSSDFLLMGIEDATQTPTPFNRFNYISPEERNQLLSSVSLLHDILGYGASSSHK